MSTESTSDNKSIHTIKKLENDGWNYSMWAMHCHMILIGLDIWDVINPTAQTSTRPTPLPTPTATAASAQATTLAPTQVPTSASIPDPIAKWDHKNSKALAQISLSVDDTPLYIIYEKETAKDAWQSLADHYNGVGAQDALILTSHLHQYQLDDSKSLEPQINKMHEMHTQLANLGDVMTDAKIFHDHLQSTSSFI